MCVEGNFEIDCKGEIMQVNKGETILLPATINSCSLKSKMGTILEVYL